MGRRSALRFGNSAVLMLLVGIFGWTSQVQGRVLPNSEDAKPLIVGGVEAYPGEFPWLVSIQVKAAGNRYLHSCGGTIVNNNHIVTAAHCVPEYPRDGDLRIVAGAHRINETEWSQQIVEIARVTRHFQYNDDYLPFDIAVVEVFPPFYETERVSQVQMPPNQIVASGVCQIAGWGQITTGNITVSSVLMKADIPVVSKIQCQGIYSGDFDPETQMCAGRQEGGIDACNGDTGGPLICNNLGYKFFAGISSWGYGCAHAGKPGVYTDVAKFIEWIHSPHKIEMDYYTTENY